MKTKLLFAILFCYTFFLTAQNLVAYYPFNGNANDESANANHGTVNGATLTEDRFGNANRAYNFTGLNHITFPTTAAHQTDSFTISWWFKAVLSGDRAVLSCVGGSGGYQQFMIGNGFSYLSGYNFPMGSTPFSPVATLLNLSNTWHQVIVTYQKTGTTSVTKLYINGILIKTDNHNMAIGFPAGSMFFLGKNHDTLNFNGDLDEFRMYDFVLNDIEAQNLFIAENTGLVAFYPFNGDADDESGNTNHGAVNGAALTTDRFGAANSAYEFDGIDDFIVIPNHSTFNVADNMTISAWIKSSNTSGPRVILSKWNDNAGDHSFIFKDDNTSDKLRIQLSKQTNSDLADLIGTTSIPIGNWIFVAATLSENTVKLYINGNLDATILATGSIRQSITDLLIGAVYTGGGITENFSGSLDDIKIYNKGLTQEEIKNEYRDLVAYYPFNGNANDESGNTNHGAVNGAALTADRFGAANSAYEFDGIDDFIQVANSSSLDIISNALTINMWLYNDNPDTGNSWKGISKGGYDVGNGYELIFTNGNTNGNLSLNIGGGGYFMSNFNSHSNQWVMLTGTFNNGEGKIYINGIEQAKTQQGSINLNSSSSDLYIGKRNPANNFAGFVKGKIDDIRLYQSALTEAEILNLYNFNFLNIDKIENVVTNNFYVYDQTLFFKNNQNLEEIKGVEVFNLLGQKVFYTEDIAPQITMDALQKGVYVVKVQNKNGKSQSLKFLVNR